MKSGLNNVMEMTQQVRGRWSEPLVQDPAVIITLLVLSLYYLLYYLSAIKTLSQSLTRSAKKKQKTEKKKKMTRWQDMKGPWQPRLAAFSPVLALFFWSRCCGRWAIITGRQSVCWSGMLYLQLPLSWPGPHYRSKTEQIKRRGLAGIWSNLYSPPGWPWSAAGREKGQWPRSFSSWETVTTLQGSKKPQRFLAFMWPQ